MIAAAACIPERFLLEGLTRLSGLRRNPASFQLQVAHEASLRKVVVTNIFKDFAKINHNPDGGPAFVEISLKLQNSPFNTCPLITEACLLLQ